MCTDNQLPQTVTKCLNTAPERLTRDDFETALEDLAKSSRQPTETFEQAYARELRSETGVRLYSGYDAAPVAPSAIRKQHTQEPESWSSITKAASALRATNPQLTEAQAIAKALEQQPELYTQYCNETEMQAQRQQLVSF